MNTNRSVTPGVSVAHIPAGIETKQYRPIAPGQSVVHAPAGAALRVSSGDSPFAELLGARKVVPTDYATYSCLLITDQRWLLKDSAAIERAHAAWTSFGRAIGERHLAVWMRGDAAELEYDVGRAVPICHQFGIDLRHTPAVVIARPAANGLGGWEHLSLRMHRLEMPNIADVLTALSAQITSGNLDQGKLNVERDWAVVAQFFQKTLAAIGQVGVEFGPVKLSATLRD